jgi:tripartite ATP-independent transporter DctM subunit
MLKGNANEPKGVFVYLLKVARILDRFNPIVRWVYIIGMGICFLWVCFVFADVVLRYVFDRPLPAGQVIVQVALVFVVFSGVAYVQLKGNHITVDVISSRLPPGAARVVNAIISPISIGVAGVLVWRGVINTLELIGTGAVSNVCEIPWAIPAAVIPFCCALLLIVLLRDFLSKLVEAGKLHLGGHIWLLMLGTPTMIIILLALWMQGVIPGPNPVMVGIIGVVVSFGFIFLGMPIALALVMIGFVFIGYLVAPEPGFSVAGTALFWHAADYNWTVVALFILMGAFIMHFGLGTDAYDTAYKWLGHFPGGLAMATVGASTALASVVGDPISSTATIAGVALPEMKKYKYDQGLATGVTCAGATLGPMIPPSVPLIIYGILAEESIGRLFIAGIIPGLMLAFGFGAVIYTQCRRNPELGPAGERASWSARLLSLKGGGPILLLFLIVIGGIYAGAFSPMEGGGIGAFMTFVIALLMGRITWRNFWVALFEGGKLIAMILFMVACALVFGHLLAASNLTTMLVEFVEGLPVSPLMVMAVIMLLFLLLGCVMDAPVLLLLTVPILAPVAVALHFDLIWFGVLLVLMTNLGMITPPYAMIIFLLRGLAPDIPIGTMYRGILPFVLSTLAVAILILFFPALTTWLPNVLMR